jgi:hypothetical protein
MNHAVTLSDANSRALKVLAIMRTISVEDVANELIAHGLTTIKARPTAI